MDKARRSTPPSWLWISIVWIGIGLLDATQSVLTMHSQGMHHAWTELFITQLIGWIPWILATRVAVHLGRQYPPSNVKSVRSWCIHVGAIVGISLLWALWMSTLEVWLDPWLRPGGPGRFATVLPISFFNRLLSAAILYAFIQAVAYVLDSRQRIAEQQTEAARLNEQLSKAQLDALRRQLEPHFLFNTLNAIAGLVREQKNEVAVTTIVRLSDFLRRVVKDSNRSRVPLLEEVEFMEQYLEIQKVRLGDRLQTSVNVPSELLHAEVPNLVLQPLVENAIKHGIARRSQGGAVRVDASQSNGTLRLSVYNDGPLLPADWESTQGGTGIANLKDRLQILYGTNFNLRLENSEASGVLVSVSVPFQEA